MENENSPIEGRRLPEASERQSVEARKSSGEVQERHRLRHSIPGALYRASPQPLFLPSPCLLRRSSIYLPIIIIIPTRQRLKYRLPRALPSLLLSPPRPFPPGVSSSFEHLYLAISRHQPSDCLLGAPELFGAWTLKWCSRERLCKIRSGEAESWLSEELEALCPGKLGRGTR